MRESYRHQVKLLLQVLPFVAKEKIFALKGGTAINFFIRDFPRLSIDIDLTYLPVKDRSESLKDIKDGVERIATELEKQITGSRIVRQMSGGTVSRLLIRSPEAQIKLEVNTVLRGTIFDPI